MFISVEQEMIREIEAEAAKETITQTGQRVTRSGYSLSPNGTTVGLGFRPGCAGGSSFEIAWIEDLVPLFLEETKEDEQPQFRRIQEFC